MCTEDAGGSALPFISERPSARSEPLTHQNSPRKDGLGLVLDISFGKDVIHNIRPFRWISAITHKGGDSASTSVDALLTDVSARLCGGHSGSAVLPASVPAVPTMSHREPLPAGIWKRDAGSHLAAGTFTHARRTNFELHGQKFTPGRNKKNTGRLDSYQRKSPPSKNMRASARRSAFFTSNQIPLCARHSAFISRMCFWSSTNMSQCDTARRFTQRPSQLTCSRQSFAFFGPQSVLVEGLVFSPLFVLHHASLQKQASTHV